MKEPSWLYHALLVEVAGSQNLFKKGVDEFGVGDRRRKVDCQDKPQTG